jgi:pyruvate dehydrogenase E2 component (dihydrolipoamide acetyltransferase)
MPTNVTMPQMGESIFEGTITKWLKKPGDIVKRDEPLFEISTEKVDSEIPSPAEGILQQILFPEGSVVQVNTVVAIIVGKEEGIEKKVQGAAPEIEPIGVPAPDRPVPPVEAVEPASAGAGNALEIKSETAGEVPSGQAQVSVEPQVSTTPPELAQPKDIRTSPLVRRLARENGVDLAFVEGTGLDGRITKQDILDYIARKSKTAAGKVAAETAVIGDSETPSPAIREMLPETQAQGARLERAATAVAAAVQPPVPMTARTEPFAGDAEVALMTPMRKAIAEHMVFSKHTSAHVHTIFEVDLTSVMHVRDLHKAEFERKEGIKLTVTPFIAKAFVETIRDFPVMNCSVEGENILYKKPINLGIAVALDNGLIVPVLKDAHLKSLTGFALGIQDLASRARTKRLRIDEVQNGTITMTNPGSYGELFSTPIINQPQVAILSAGSVVKRPMIINDMIAVRSMVYLTLAFDHRVIDGAVADQFMAKLKERLESWNQWME